MTRRSRGSHPGASPPPSGWRIAAVFVAWIAAFALLGARLVELQVIHAGTLQRLASRQHLGTLRLPGRRGLILDRRGSRLAVNVEADSVYAVPRIIPDPTAFAREVAPRLQLSVGEVEARLRRGGSHFAWLARRQPRQTADAILALATLPTFDPNQYQAVPATRWKNPAVADLYEPGSTFKLILAATALSSHAVGPSETFPDPGKIRINGATIYDAEAQPRRNLTLAEIVKY